MKEKYKILDLFSGIGGFSLGLERPGHFETTAFCEIDKFCKLILDKHWKGTKIYDNVKEITKERLEADGIQFPDIITGGFPCQSFSVAGKQKGTSDSRYLWPEMFRIIKIFKPRYVIGENVRGIVNIENGMVFETVCSNLEDEGYEVQPFLIPAASVGAPHRRERIWFIAIREESVVDTNNIRFEQHIETEEEASRRRSSATFEPTSDVVNSDNDGSPATTIGGSFKETSNNDQKGQNKTSESEGTSRRERNENLENSRRTLQQGTELGKKNEDEIRKEDAHQHQRSGSPSESDVANTQGERTRENDEGLRSRTSGVSGRQETTMANATESRPPSESVGNSRSMGEEIKREEEGRNQSSVRTTARSTKGFEDVADTNLNREKWNQSEDRKGSRVEQDDWWLVEPNVGRVAHGVSGRVYRLKALGNSIVPQIVEEIGRAIIKAERE